MIFNTIRWILFLPAAIASYVALAVIFSPILSHELSLASFYYAHVPHSFLAAFSFVYVGASVAPKNNKIVSYWMAALLAIFISMFRISELRVYNGVWGPAVLSLLCYIVYALGAYTAIRLVKDKK